MTNTEDRVDGTSAATATDRTRVVMTMGGKGGVGKTAFTVALVDWYRRQGLPVTLLDLDTENKTVGSLRHYFGGLAAKVDIHTPAGLDVFLDRLADSEVPIILADMGAGAGQVTHQWFDQMYQDVAGMVVFTAVGIVTPDPASVNSVLAWATRLQDRVQYLIVENAISPLADFSYWRETEEAGRFRMQFRPIVLSAEYRLAELEHAARQHGVTLAQVATRQSAVPELSKSSLVIRAQGYSRRLLAEFDKAAELLIP